MPTPILTDTLIRRVLQDQQRELAQAGQAGRVWPETVAVVLGTLTPEGWCQIGSLRLQGLGREPDPPWHYAVWWHVDTGDVRLERMQSPHAV